MIEKRESLFPTKDGKPRGIFTLTKIPQKNDDDDNTGNIRLKMAFNKAKDAARVVRRLQYSYSMRVNILLSKPIFQKNEYSKNSKNPSICKRYDDKKGFQRS